MSMREDRKLETAGGVYGPVPGRADARPYPRQRGSWWHTRAVVAFAAWAGLAIAAPEGPRLGQPVTSAELATMDIHVFPDGTGLPSGRGTAAEGKHVYDSQCASCHGAAGMGGTGGELAGRSPLSGPQPDQTVGNYWPYATTLFDFVRRSMPLNAPRSLSNDQVYAVSAYILHLNGIIGEKDEMNAHALAAVKMPNREGFVRVWPESNHTP